MFTKYNQLARARPLTTNVLTTGFLFGLGDYVAQTVEQKQQPQLDAARTGRAAVYGACLFAPAATQWYRVLARVLVGRLPALNTMARVGLDQLVFAPFVGVPLYYGAMAAMESGDVRAVRHKIEQNWWATLKSNWLVWPAVQAVNFGVVPPEARLLVVNVVSIGWNTYLLMVNSGLP